MSKFRDEWLKRKQRQPDKFWPWVRPLIWEKAQELYQMEQAKTMGKDFKGIRAERSELWEGGYFYQAKLIVLRNLWQQKKRLTIHRRRGSRTRIFPNLALAF